jgi:hypothetical protein
MAISAVHDTATRQRITSISDGIDPVTPVTAIGDPNHSFSWSYLINYIASGAATTKLADVARRAARMRAAEEVKMKRLILVTLLLGATALTVICIASFATAAPPGKEIDVANIPDKTKLMRATLQGRYIFVHDDSKMAKGEPCLYVYEYSEDQAGRPEAKPDKLVVSFHCVPVQREKATRIVLTYGMLSPDLFELREIQFTGSTEAHRVP